MKQGHLSVTTKAPSRIGEQFTYDGQRYRIVSPAKNAKAATGAAKVRLYWCQPLTESGAPTGPLKVIDDAFTWATVNG